MLKCQTLFCEGGGWSTSALIKYSRGHNTFLNYHGKEINVKVIGRVGWWVLRDKNVVSANFVVAFSGIKRQHVQPQFVVFLRPGCQFENNFPKQYQNIQANGCYMRYQGCS